MKIAAAVVLALACALPAYAQQARPSSFAVETSAAIDDVAGVDGGVPLGVTVDAVVSADFGRGFQGLVRPFAQRTNTGEWNRQVWIAAVRYERAGTVGLRLDGGLIPSPIGLANLTLRPHMNPTISQPSSLFTSLPPLEPGPARRATLLGAVYAYGAQATVSGARWDARAAVIDNSPLRTRRVFAETNPPQFMNVVLGGGFTPLVGVRMGASLTHGGWQQAGETPLVTEDRDATIVTVESEAAFAYTRVSAEWVRDRLETSTGTRIASGWFVQGQQTLTPRWFVAGRLERIASPAVLFAGTTPTAVLDERLNGVEETLGYRLTPEITLRASHRARRSFGRTEYDHTLAVSAVWWKRWM
jgi:hypothetical protein